MRLRKSQKLRTTRVKECTILPCLDEGMVTDDPYIARRAIAMCMHLKSQVGLHFMGYSVLRGLVACRQRLKYLLDLIDEPDDADNFATAPPTKPWPLHDEYLENMTEIPEIRSKDWYKFTLRQLNVLKQRIGLRPEEWEEKLGPTPLRKEPSFLAVCWSKYALELKAKRLKDLAERHDERIMKITSTSRSTGSSTKENEDLDMTAKDLDPLYLSDDSSSDAQENLLAKESEYMAQARAEADSRGAKVDEKSEMVVLTTEQISQASEEETRMANTMVFGPSEDYLRGALFRINVHQGPSKLRFSPFRPHLQFPPSNTALPIT